MGCYFTRASKLAGLEDIAPERDDLMARMRAVSIDPGALRCPEMTVDFGALCALLGDCAQAWNMPDLGLRMARRQGIEVLGPVALIARMERSVRSAVKAINSNLVIHSNVVSVFLEEAPDSDAASIIIDLRSDAPNSRESVELILAQAKMVLEAIAETNVPLLEASFRHGRAASAKAVSAYFECPILYGADRNAISFGKAVLDRPLQRRDLAFHGLITRYLATARAEVVENLLEDVRSEVARQMELGICSLENVARSLRLSPRSLQRRLKDHGTAFGDVVGAWRRARALLLVTHTHLPLSKIAEMVGHSEQSTFSRAFRRWFGETPLQCRAGKTRTP